MLQTFSVHWTATGSGRTYPDARANQTRNHRSQQAIARLGAHYEGTLRRHFRRSDGSIRDSVLFSITADEWPAVQTRLTERLGR